MASTAVQPNNRGVAFLGKKPRTGVKKKAGKLAKRGLVSPKAMKKITERVGE